MNLNDLTRGSQVRPRRSSRCDCRIRCTVAYCHQESVTRATCAARPSLRSSPWNGTKSNNTFNPWTARSARCATRCSGLSTAWTTTRASTTVGRNRSDRVRACLTCQGTPRNELNRHFKGFVALGDRECDWTGRCQQRDRPRENHVVHFFEFLLSGQKRRQTRLERGMISARTFDSSGLHHLTAHLTLDVAVQFDFIYFDFRAIFIMRMFIID